MTGDKWRAQSAQVSRGDKQKMAEGRQGPFGVGVICYEDVVEPVISVHGHGTRESNRGDTRNGCELVLNFLLNTRDASIVGHIGIRNRNAKRLQLGRADESWVDARQYAKRSNHQPGTNQHYQSECNLQSNQRVLCAMTLSARAERAIAFRKACPHARILERGDQAEKKAGKEPNAERKNEHWHVHANVVHAREPGWRKPDEILQ